MIIYSTHASTYRCWYARACDFHAVGTCSHRVTYTLFTVAAAGGDGKDNSEVTEGTTEETTEGIDDFEAYQVLCFFIPCFFRLELIDFFWVYS